jgi:hypothetical protein
MSTNIEPNMVQALAHLSTEAQTDGAWLPMPGESAQAYYAFRMWLEQGALRPKVISRVSSVYSWDARALAYDDYRLANPQIPEQTPQERHEQNLRTIQLQKHIVFTQCVKLMSALEASQAPAMTLEQLAKITDTLVKLERLETDQSTTNVSFRGPDISKLSDEELAQLDQIAQKAEEQT